MSYMFRGMDLSGPGGRDLFADVASYYVETDTGAPADFTGISLAPPFAATDPDGFGDFVEHLSSRAEPGLRHLAGTLAVEGLVVIPDEREEAATKVSRVLELVADPAMTDPEHLAILKEAFEETLQSVHQKGDNEKPLTLIGLSRGIGLYRRLWPDNSEATSSESPATEIDT